jgi:hypothetical protein
MTTNRELCESMVRITEVIAEEMKRTHPEEFAFVTAKMDALKAATSGVLSELPFEVVAPVLLACTRAWQEEWEARQNGGLQ